MTHPVFSMSQYCSLEDLLEEKREYIAGLIDKSGFSFYVSIVDNDVYAVHYTGDSTTQDNETVRQFISEDLDKLGLELDNYQIEHDCISGFLRLIEPKTKQETNIQDWRHSVQ